MRNYYDGSDLRPANDNDEPELQWLEDSINYLCWLTFMSLKEICRTLILIVCGVYHTFKKTK